MGWKEWIKNQGVEIVAKDLSLSPQAIYAWLRDGSGKRPSDINKKKLVDIANGEFGYADFFTDIKKAVNE